MEDAIRILKVDRLQAKVYADRKALGLAAGNAVIDKLRDLLPQKRVSMIFAAAASQLEFLETLAQAKGIDWSRVSAFHMDEYVGLPLGAPRSLGRWLRDRFLDRVRPGEVHLLDGMAKDPEQECVRYAKLLEAAPPDITCIGIGENGHLAFNDPPFADFADPKRVKIVQPDEVSRQQQVSEGAFPSLAEMPTKAYTLTVPTLFASTWIYSMVPGPRKAKAVKRTLDGAIATECPATILRRHERTVLYLDRDSAGLIDTAIAGR